MNEKLPTVLMYGGGRQSITIACLIIQGKLPVPDWTIIADTGREKETTWAYLDKYIRPNYPREIHRVDKSAYATVDLYGGKEKDSLLIPAFTNQNGKLGKLETFCSNEWKARVCDRFLKRTNGVKDWISWIGFATDEPRRWQAKRRSMGEKVWFPLVDGIPMTSLECKLYPLVEFGWPIPVHSACYMCPLQSDDNWMENTPDDHQRAIEFDRQIAAKDPNVFLHRSLVRVENMKPKTLQPNPEPCDSGLCML